MDFQQMILPVFKNSKNKILLAAFLLLGLLCLCLSQNSKDPTPEIKDKESVDTYIPKGFVLVPIEVANANSLGSLLNETGGVVDLYANKDKNKSEKVASKLKILRAPYNPDLYAVLVRDEESSHLLSYPGPFVAVIQNPAQKGEAVAKPGTRKVTVDYQN